MFFGCPLAPSVALMNIDYYGVSVTEKVPH